MKGALTGWTTESGNVIAYRNRLSVGKYLIIARGTAAFTREAMWLLRHHSLENIQVYDELAEG